MVLTKNYSLPANGGCPAGQTPPANGACPGALVTYSIDYRNIVVGAPSEASFINAWPWTGAGSFVVTENGAAGSNNWASSGFSCGLNEALVAGANGTTTFGDSTAGSAFTTAAFHLDLVHRHPGRGRLRARAQRHRQHRRADRGHQRRLAGHADLPGPGHALGHLSMSGDRFGTIGLIVSVDQGQGLNVMRSTSY